MSATQSDPVTDAARHVPVLLDEVLDALAARPGEVIVDGTFGAGGYTRAILATGAEVIAVDRDPNAIRDGQALVAESGGRLHLVQGRFGQLDQHAAACGFDAVDGVVLDLGISSMQVDEAERGFSFRQDGPLDMRMEQAGVSAADVVNTMDGRDLARVIGVLGEEKRAGSISRAIVAAREETPFTRTSQLADLVEKTIGRKPGKAIHPATKTFQGLRIYVNDELGEVVSALAAAERALRAGGRLVVVSFHSLEDRIVKRFLADRCRTIAGGSRHLPEADVPPATFSYGVKGAVDPGEAEVARNPRARSAKLRAGVRTDAPARNLDTRALGFPRVPAFKTLGG
ncbi:16S rRNA (cytosine(1402)-N(4))-methyltransferase RsmH [Breoghania sp. L-A4]|uniref:16S rRNA (cytosine(1402)-N(4))-methyltransferase RsmH n=1 Tax=Breoghania sp. L-A4 TaxID=2304600 RepID=UPI0020BF5958|nr:16S rRNA (cytosine(1402)-N(4))-methyltransferase RsmH [Breoghania sp. L-A4]